MQRTANFHHQIADAGFSEAAGVVDTAAALDTAVDVLDSDPATRDAPIGRFLRPREGPAPGLLGGHDDLDLVQGERQEAQVLEQPAPRRQGVRGRIRNAFIVGTTRIGLAQKKNRERGIDQQHVFDRVVLFLAAITARLLSRILWAPDAPFGPIMAKRGEGAAGVSGAAGGLAGGTGSSVGMSRAAASASVTPRRWAKSCKDRLGAFPKAPRVAFSIPNRR